MMLESIHTPYTSMYFIRPSSYTIFKDLNPSLLDKFLVTILYFQTILVDIPRFLYVLNKICISIHFRTGKCIHIIRRQNYKHIQPSTWYTRLYNLYIVHCGIENVVTWKPNFKCRFIVKHDMVLNCLTFF